MEKLTTSARTVDATLKTIGASVGCKCDCALSRSLAELLNQQLEVVGAQRETIERLEMSAMHLSDLSGRQ